MRNYKSAKELLTESLIELMQTKDYASITITDIANNAYVSRKSYYRIFDSKDAILHNYLEELTKEYLEELPPYQNKRPLDTILVTFLEHMKKQDELAILLYKNNLFHILEQHICNAFFERYKNSVSDEVLYFFSGACFQVYVYYFKSRYEIPSYQLAKNITLFMQNTL